MFLQCLESVVPIMRRQQRRSVCKRDKAIHTYLLWRGDGKHYRARFGDEKFILSKELFMAGEWITVTTNLNKNTHVVKVLRERSGCRNVDACVKTIRVSARDSHVVAP